MQIFGHDLLTNAAFAGNQDRGVGRGHLIGQGDDGGHGRITCDEGAIFGHHGGQNRCDQLGIWRQGNKLFCASPYGVTRTAGIGGNSAGHHRHVNALGLVGGDKRGNVEVVIHHQQVSALTCAQRVGGLGAAVDMRHLRARGHSHLHRCGKLSAQSSDD